LPVSSWSPTCREARRDFTGAELTGNNPPAVISADRYSRAFERKRHSDYNFQNVSEVEQARRDAERSTGQVAKQWLSEQRYPIVFGSWVASMAIAFGLVGRSPYLTGQQKLVQARVYAQGLTLAVLLASFALEGNDIREGKGRWETVKVLDPDDPTHKRMIEKKIHHEAYTGEDQWMGKWLEEEAVSPELTDAACAQT